MKVVLFATKDEIGSEGRGIGVYTKLLYENLTSKKTSGLSVEIASNTKEADIVHFPSFKFFRPQSQFLINKPFIVTIHDCIPLIYPKYYPPGLKGKLSFLYQKTMLKKARAIITDSETSKKDIVRFLKIPQQKVHVVYLGPTIKKSLKAMTVDIHKKYDLPKKFVLYVGDVNHNKNILQMAKACHESGTHLVIVGSAAVRSNYDSSHPENQQLHALIENYKDSKYIKRVGYVLDEELYDFYSSCELYIHPSLYEGFGLGALDAFSVGKPVLAARNQVNSELWGDCVHYFDPKEEGDLKKKLIELMKQPKLRNSKLKEAKLVMKKYSWAKTAAKMFDIYQRVGCFSVLS